MTAIKRRTFLKGTLANSVIAAAVGSGVLRPARVLAAEWPKNAFAAKTPADALKALYDTSSVTETNAIKVKAPIQAEDGAVVPITISTSLPDVDSIAVIVEKNPRPFATRLSLTGAGAYFSARIKMDQTSNVQCVVRSGGKVYMTKKLIKVTVGGYGG